jgi:hypothetical protein
MTDDQPIPPAPQTEKDSRNNVAHPDRNAVSEVKIPPSHASYKITCEKKRDKWDVSKLVAEFIGLAFLILYTLYTAGIYCANRKAAEATQNTFHEIQQQTTLMRQQVVGTMSAIVIFQEPRITNDPTTNKEILVMQLLNRGHVISPEAHITFEIAIASFPQMEAIHQAQSYAISVPQFGETGWSKNYPLPDLSAQDTHFPSQRKTVTVKGKFGFDNGFGDKITDQEFCYSYIGSYNIKNEDGGSTSGGGGFIPCDEFGGKVSYISAHQLK